MEVKYGVLVVIKGHLMEQALFLNLENWGGIDPPPLYSHPVPLALWVILVMLDLKEEYCSGRGTVLPNVVV